MSGSRGNLEAISSVIVNVKLGVCINRKLIIRIKPMLFQHVESSPPHHYFIVRFIGINIGWVIITGFITLDFSSHIGFTSSYWTFSNYAITLDSAPIGRYALL